MKKDKRMRLVSERDEYKLFEFTPSVFKLSYAKIGNIYFSRWLRLFLFTAAKKLAIYYLFYEDIPIGHFMLTRGKSRHYEFLTKNDVVVGPLYILSEYRGKKLSYYLMGTALQKYKEDHGYDKAYGYAWKTNVQSNKLLVGLGFSVCANAYLTKFIRSVKVTHEEAMYSLYVR